MRGRKKTDLINQIFIASVLTQRLHERKMEMFMAKGLGILGNNIGNQVRIVGLT